MCEKRGSLHNGDIVNICSHGRLKLEYSEARTEQSRAGRPIPLLVIDTMTDGSRVKLVANRTLIEDLDGLKLTRDTKFQWSVPTEHLKYISSIGWKPPEAFDRWKILDLE